MARPGTVTPECHLKPTPRSARSSFWNRRPRNEILPLPGAQAAAELFARAFVPHYLSDGIRFTLNFFDELTRSVPCSVFRFAPTESAVEAIRHVRA